LLVIIIKITKKNKLRELFSTNDCHVDTITNI